MLTLFGKIAEHLFGHKYYCVTFEEQFSEVRDTCPPRHIGGYIFRSKETALQYYYQMKASRTFQPVEIVSFRSRTFYKPFNNNYNVVI